MQMPNRAFSDEGYRYGFNGMEADDEIKNGDKNSYDFGARMYDQRVGRFLSLDPHAVNYASISPFIFVNNMPIWAVDPDGKDIIILSAPSGANGMGHGAALIGNDKDGWRLYSKNGTQDHGSVGASYNPNLGTPYKTLQDFANSKDNFIKGSTPYYTSAFRIESSDKIDAIMEEAALEQCLKDYNLFQASCIDVPSDALIAGGFNGGTADVDTKYKDQMPAVPRIRYNYIVKNNKGKDITSSIQPSSEVKRLERISRGEEDTQMYEVVNKGVKYNSNDSDNTRVVNDQITPVLPTFEEKIKNPELNLTKDQAKKRLKEIRRAIGERGKGVK